MITLWPGFYAIANAIPERLPGAVGRPNEYPILVYLLQSGLTLEITSGSKAQATLRHPHVWALARRNIKHMTDVDLPEKPPSRYQLYYGGRKLAHDHAELISQTFTDIAITLSHQLGFLRPEAPFSVTNPAPQNTMNGDGKVLSAPVEKPTAERWKQEGRPVPTEWGLHKEGGTSHLEYGSKFMTWNTRGDATPNKQVILAINPCGSNEAAVAVATALTIIRKTGGGVHAITYDGGFHGKHIKPLQSAGAQVFCPVSANVKRRFYEKIECTCGITHELFLDKGRLHEREILDTGAEHFEPCHQEAGERRPNKNTFRWYINIRLTCGRSCRIPNHDIPTDVAARFNRQENLRMSTRTPDKTSTYDRVYPRRPNSESINNLIERNLANRQVVGYTLNKQWLLLLGMGIARNALAWHLWQRSQAPPNSTAA